ncbi:MAG: hypothetical protein HYT63_00345 [Candidatus Yanofskybacteria bacterium]|nr:hypothetical protein [Candidatus Yanofskybacteria bacterium]
MRLSIKQYINRTIRQKAKIRYDKSVKQWFGVLDHTLGLICSQRKTKVAVQKELAEILEEFIALSFTDNRNETKTSKTQRAYSQA